MRHGVRQVAKVIDEGVSEGERLKYMCPDSQVA